MAVECEKLESRSSRVWRSEYVRHSSCLRGTGAGHFGAPAPFDAMRIGCQGRTTDCVRAKRGGFRVALAYGDLAGQRIRSVRRGPGLRELYGRLMRS